MTKKILFAITFFLVLFLNVKAEENPYLKEIRIDGEIIEGFDSNVKTYNINVPLEKESVKISYVFPDGKNGGDYLVSKNFSLNENVNLVAGKKNVFTIELTDSKDGSKKTLYTINITRPDNRSSNNLLKTLVIDSKRVTLLEDEVEYEIYVDNTKTKIEAMATTQDLNAKFLPGYGERIGNNAVTLSGEKTYFEIKVEAENGDIRTYKITIIKSGYKSNDATLKSLKIKEIEFEFKPNIYIYNLEVENDIKEINIEAVANDLKAEVLLPSDLILKEGINNFIIKVEAEDETTLEYKINITRKEKEVLVSNITVDDIVLDFNPNTYDYEILTSKKNLNFHIKLNSKTATYNVLNNQNLKNGSVVRILVKDKNREVYYNFKIINQEEVLNNNDTNMLQSDIASGAKSFKKYELFIGLGALAVGSFGLLLAILTKPKKSQEE